MKEHIENLQKSFELSSQQIDDAVNPLEVAALFESENVSYVLIGGHMLSYYTGTARATVDVNVIIGVADFERASTAIYRGGGKELVAVVNDIKLGKATSL
jgi:hypothetical protein